MKKKSAAICLILFFCVELFSQVGLFNAYAIQYSAKNHAYKKFVVTTIGRHGSWSAECASFKGDSLKDMLLSGLDSAIITAGKNPKKLFLEKYKEQKPSKTWGFKIHFDSLKNQLEVSDTNPYYLSSTFYTFDSLGRISVIANTYVGEASGSEGSSITFYSYDISKRTVSYGPTNIEDRSATKNMYTYSTTVEMDPTLTFPICETYEQKGAGILSTYKYFYNKKCLKKIIVTDIEKGVVKSTVESNYKFE